MIKKFGWWMGPALVAGALIAQGCTQTGGVKDAAPAAATPASAPIAATDPHASAAPIPEYEGKPVVAADTKDHFEAVAAAIRQQMQAGGRFSFVNHEGRASVHLHLNDMGALFDQYGSVDLMPPIALSKLLDDQNAINEVLARYDANRVVCHEEMPVGTHFPKKVCLTLRQIEEQNNSAQQMMRESQKRPSQIGGH